MWSKDLRRRRHIPVRSGYRRALAVAAARCEHRMWRKPRTLAFADGRASENAPIERSAEDVIASLEDEQTAADSRALVEIMAANQRA